MHYLYSIFRSQLIYCHKNLTKTSRKLQQNSYPKKSSTWIAPSHRSTFKVKSLLNFCVLVSIYIWFRFCYIELCLEHNCFRFCYIDIMFRTCMCLFLGMNSVHAMCRCGAVIGWPLVAGAAPGQVELSALWSSKSYKKEFLYQVRFSPIMLRFYNFVSFVILW